MKSNFMTLYTCTLCTVAHSQLCKLDRQVPASTDEYRRGLECRACRNTGSFKSKVLNKHWGFLAAIGPMFLEYRFISILDSITH